VHCTRSPIFFCSFLLGVKATAPAPAGASFLRCEIDGAERQSTGTEVRIYNRALPAAEVQQLYKLGTVTIHSN
jgi:hypothetical protein